MNDRKATQVAESKGVTVIDITIFLLYGKNNNTISLTTLKELLAQLKEKDHYNFSEEVKRILRKFQ